MRDLRSLGALLGACLSCSHDPVGTSIDGTKAAPALEAAAPPRDLSEARLQLRALFGLELDPVKARHASCDDGLLVELAPEEGARVLSTRVVEARPEARTLLPLSISELLESTSLSRLESALSSMGSEADRRLAQDEVRSLATQRFIGVFHVTRFQEPKWIWRLDRKKPEWVPGHLETWLQIHDAQSGERLCQTRIFVTNDTREAPLTQRQKAVTRERLTAELGRETRKEAQGALSRISRALSLPRAALAEVPADN